MGTPTRISAAVSAAILGACATPYKPESAIYHDGYSEQRREPGVYDVWFRGNHYTPEDKADDLVVLRAADLCLGEGKSFMRTSDFQSDTSLSVVTKGFPVRRSVQYIPPSGAIPSPIPTVVGWTPGRELYKTQSSLKVECLAEKSDDAQEVAAVAALLRERYNIATKSNPPKPDTTSAPPQLAPDPISN